MKEVVPLFRYPVVSLKKTKDWLLCILSAILLILSFPKFNLWILAWFAFVPLFFALRDKSKFKAFLLFCFTGIIFWLGIVYWLFHVTFAGLILLVLYLALYFGVFGFIIACYPLYAPRYTLFFIPSVWVLLEYLRSHLFTGFGWGLLGYSQYLNLPAIQIADITGAWGVSFLVMTVNVLIYRITDYVLRFKIKKQIILTTYLLPLLLLFLCLGYGFYKLRTTHYEGSRRLRISIIQGNIPQSIKWQEYAKEEIFRRYLQLTREAVSDNPDLIIWPEAALPGIMGEDPRLRDDLGEFVYELKLPLLAGAVRAQENAYYNSALLISKHGEIIQRYDKLHLVPFGEYIPLKRIFSFLETVVPIGDFNPGKDYKVFTLTPDHYLLPAKFSVLICFEDIFPQISRRFVKKGADFLVNITNDAWFGDTSSPYQHLQASVFRAVENGVYLVRAANTGVSGFITPRGKVYPLIDSKSGKQTFVSGYKARSVILAPNQSSFYTRLGDWFALICLAFAAYGAIKNKK
ncbi:MAG: apolipoprotein N-acyltransferase [Candidatus Omnitrophota bacterium]